MIEAGRIARRLPTVRSVENELVTLISIPKPTGSYVIFEKIASVCSSSTGLFIALFNRKSKLQLGRSTDSDLRLTNLSVSRNHATLECDNGTVLLRDVNSTFGTAVCLERPISVSDEVLQVGRSLLWCKVKQPWSFLPVCFKGGERQKTPSTVLPVGNGVALTTRRPEPFLENLLDQHYLIGRGDVFMREK